MIINSIRKCALFNLPKSSILCRPYIIRCRLHWRSSRRDLSLSPSIIHIRTHACTQRSPQILLKATGNEKKTWNHYLNCVCFDMVKRIWTSHSSNRSMRFRFPSSAPRHLCYIMALSLNIRENRDTIGDEPSKTILNFVRRVRIFFVFFLLVRRCNIFGTCGIRYILLGHICTDK